MLAIVRAFAALYVAIFTQIVAMLAVLADRLAVL
jgi:hypothetical protein